MSDSLSLVFTGDIGFDRYMDGKWDDPELIAPDVLSFLHGADHVIANVEGPLVDQDTNKTTEGVVQLMHTMNPKAIGVLERMHADIWNICNNHIMDAGEDGIRATLDQAKKRGVRTLGAGMNLDEASRILELPEAGGIGMIGVGYQRGCKPAGEGKAGCFNWSDLELIGERIREIKSRSRWCIVVSHGGEEFTALPSPYTRDRYLAYLEMGADLVVCHHPHVPMNYERVGEKAIFYSLGNFIFDTDYQRAQYYTERGILLKLTFRENGWDFTPMGLRIDRETDRIVSEELPDIFMDVPEEEYKLLAPLSAKMMVAAYKRRQIYLDADGFKNATEEKWKEHFSDPKRSGRVPGEALDFLIICPLAEEAEKGEWKKSELQKVKDYILGQMEP